MSQVSLNGVSTSSKRVSRVFERRMKCASGKFQKSFKEVSRVFQESLKVF